jgi:RNA polymerase sigma-70 factor (ECF subfamily)
MQLVAEVVPFAEVYERYKGPVFRYCVSQVRNAAVAEDIASNVFISAFRVYDQTHPEGEGMRQWLFAIARNQVIDHVRRERRWQNLFSRIGRAEPQSSIEEAAAYREELRAALDKMKKLKPRDRQLVGLRLAAGLSVNDIAEVMGLSGDAAKVALRRALAKIEDARSGEQ